MESKQPKFKIGDKVVFAGNMFSPTLEVEEVIDASKAYPDYPNKYRCKEVKSNRDISSIYEEHELERSKS